METVSSEPQYGVITHTLINTLDSTFEAPAKKRKIVDPPNFKEGYGKPLIALIEVPPCLI